MVGLDAAYEACERQARTHYENFPVASVLLPRSMRRHVAALYAFARTADDFADEGSLAVAERLSLLDGWLGRLRASAGGGAQDPPRRGEPAATLDIFRALGETIRLHALPIGLFEDLLSAFRQDVEVSRYSSWPALLDYCRRSANPIGRLVLLIAGHPQEALARRSDAICTALQLTNFWQDLGSDFARGRVYVPGDLMRAHGADERDLALTSITPSWRRLLADVVGRTRTMLAQGRPLCDAVNGRLRYELRATWLGGARILDRLDATGSDVLRRRPALGGADGPWLVWRLLTWGGATP